MTLTPEDRQRIYEEEKARLEAQERLRSEAKAREALSIPDAKRESRSGLRLGCLTIIGLLLVLWIIGTLMSSSRKTTSTTEPEPRTSPGQTTVFTKDELLKNVATVTTGLQDMNVGIAGETMEHIKLSLEVFNAAAMLMLKLQSEQLSDDEHAKVSQLRTILIKRQQEALPVIRDKVGPIFSKELWLSDSKARTFGSRFTTAEFVSASFATNANIARAQEAIRAPLIRMRFKRVQYRWYAEADEHSYYTIESPSDGEVAIIDLEGNVTPVPESQP